MKKEEFDAAIRGKNINLLIGAGASVPLFETLSLGKNCPSFEDVITSENIDKDVKRLMYWYYFMNLIYPISQANEDDSEDEQADVYNNYGRLIHTLHNYLLGESNEKPKRINIFTTNYDLLFEKTFDKFMKENPLVYFNDGSRGFFTKYISNQNYFLNITHSGYNDNYRREVPTINLFKMHGSLSWAIEDERIIVSEENILINKVYDKANKIELEVANIEKRLSCKSGSELGDFVEDINQSMKPLISNKKLLDDFYCEYTKLPIINPDKYKFSQTVLEQHYYQLIRSFSYELEKRQSVLIVFGFSFADEHIKDIVYRSLLNPELQVYIISYCEDGKKQMENIFKGYNNVTFLPDDKEIKGDFDYLLEILEGKDEL